MGKRPKKPSVEERRRMLVGMGLGIGALAFIGYKLTADSSALADPYKITFEQAKEKPELRQSYLDERKALFARPYVSGIEYVTQPSVMHMGAGFQQSGSDIGKQKPILIKVSPIAFESKNVKCENDLMNILIDHEIDGHARTLYDDSPDFKKDEFFTGIDAKGEELYHSALRDVHELIAYGCQLNRSKARKTSRAHIEANFTQYCKHYTNLLRTSRKELKNPAIIDHALGLLYQPSFLNASIQGKPLISLRGEKFLWNAGDGTYIELSSIVCEKIKQVK